MAGYLGTKAVFLSTTAASVTGNITVGGTVDGRNIAADGTKLDGIESGAQVNQTAAEIKTAYESNANTNAFTDAEQTKLSGIETGADVTDTANVTAAGALMDSEVTNLAAVKAFDPADYATAAQGALADSALQSSDIGVSVQGYSSVLANTTASFTTADETKLDGIEAGADVTDTANVTAAGALMTTGGTLTGNLSFGDSDKAIFGAGSDLEIFHNGTDSFINESNASGWLYLQASNLAIRSQDFEYFIDCNANSSVDLYYDNSKKLATTATGISVTGTVAATSFTGDGSNLTGIQTSPYDQSTSSTGYFALPAGTTAQRPASPSVGWSRYNTTKSSFEYYNGTDWLASDQKPTITGLSGTVYKGSATNLTLTVAETTDLFSVRYLDGSTVVATVENQTQTNGSCTTAVPASVYNATGGTTFTVRIVNTNGVASSTSQSFVLGELPTGGTITTYGGYTVHKFTSSGTFTTGTFSGNVEYIVVAGGGGGGNRGSRWGGAGGAGGLRASISGVNSGGGASTEAPLSVSTQQSYTITIGGGGGPGAMSSGTGGQGGTSSIGTAVTTVGGGGGGSFRGGNGGSGGGGSNGDGGGTGTAGQGYNGGGSTDSGYGGGGGGAAGAGAQNSRGAALSFTDKVQSGTVSLALGGGMNTGAGAVNTGGGGDAGNGGGADSGGSGVVYLRYLTP